MHLTVQWLVLLWLVLLCSCRTAPAAAFVGAMDSEAQTTRCLRSRLHWHVCGWCNSSTCTASPQCWLKREGHPCHLLLLVRMTVLVMQGQDTQHMHPLRQTCCRVEAPTAAAAVAGKQVHVLCSNYIIHMYSCQSC